MAEHKDAPTLEGWGFVPKQQEYFPKPEQAEMRKFDTGATRNTSSNKFDYEGFLSPLVIEAFGRFMHQHRLRADGKLRDSDNWQLGIPKPEYMKSAWRHFLNVWKSHRGYRIYNETGAPTTYKEEILALMFNLMGHLHETLKEEEACVSESISTDASPTSPENS